MSETVKIGRYQHFKGNLYDVIDLAIHSETNERLVIYSSVQTGLVFARPLQMFNEEVPNSAGAMIPRFKYLGR